jgi:minor histocompatibility antigen H13
MSNPVNTSSITNFCYAIMFILTVLTSLTSLVPLHLNIAVFSLSIIIIGSYGSLHVLVQEFKKVYIQGKKSENIENMKTSDAYQFPIMAGVMLVGLYVLVKFFGKDPVNYILLIYIGIGSSTGIKALITSFTTSLNSMDEKKVIDIKSKFLELEVTMLDLVCILISCLQTALYVYSKSWIYNNILATIFCVHALQYIFLGNFKNGAILLTLLFFYDIFFVFGTDVMVTVAKSIDAPIKL